MDILRIKLGKRTNIHQNWDFSQLNKVKRRKNISWSQGPPPGWNPGSESELLGKHDILQNKAIIDHFYDMRVKCDEKGRNDI